ncbi:YdcF family protein [Patescibacteria group bacterium]|nr:MAG: YdcF family protein [Patescibacteria group bacterium]
MFRILCILGDWVDPVNRLNQTTVLRLEAGLRVWEKGGYDVMLLTSGISLPPHKQTIPIATLMREWMLAAGVPGHKIVAEIRSRDTFENIEFSTAILVEKGLTPGNSTLCLLSHWQHVCRADITAKSYGWRTDNLPLRYSIGCKGLVIGSFMVIVHLFDPRGKGVIPRWNRAQRTF